MPPQKSSTSSKQAEKRTEKSKKPMIADLEQKWVTVGNMPEQKSALDANESLKLARVHRAWTDWAVSNHADINSVLFSNSTVGACLVHFLKTAGCHKQPSLTDGSLLRISKDGSEELCAFPYVEVRATKLGTRMDLRNTLVTGFSSMSNEEPWDKLDKFAVLPSILQLRSNIVADKGGPNLADNAVQYPFVLRLQDPEYDNSFTKDCVGRGTYALVGMVGGYRHNGKMVVCAFMRVPGTAIWYSVQGPQCLQFVSGNGKYVSVDDLPMFYGEGTRTNPTTYLTIYQRGEDWEAKCLSKIVIKDIATFEGLARVSSMGPLIRDREGRYTSSYTGGTYGTAVTYGTTGSPHPHDEDGKPITVEPRHQTEEAHPTPSSADRPIRRANGWRRRAEYERMTPGERVVRRMMTRTISRLPVLSEIRSMNRLRREWALRAISNAILKYKKARYDKHMQIIVSRLTEMYVSQVRIRRAYFAYKRRLDRLRWQQHVQNCIAYRIRRCVENAIENTPVMIAARAYDARRARALAIETEYRAWRALKRQEEAERELQAWHRERARLRRRDLVIKRVKEQEALQLQQYNEAQRRMLVAMNAEVLRRNSRIVLTDKQLEARRQWHREERAKDKAERERQKKAALEQAQKEKKQQLRQRERERFQLVKEAERDARMAREAELALELETIRAARETSPEPARPTVRAPSVASSIATTAVQLPEFSDHAQVRSIQRVFEPSSREVKHMYKHAPRELLPNGSVKIASGDLKLWRRSDGVVGSVARKSVQERPTWTGGAIAEEPEGTGWANGVGWANGAGPSNPTMADVVRWNAAYPEPGLSVEQMQRNLEASMVQMALDRSRREM